MRQKGLGRGMGQVGLVIWLGCHVASAFAFDPPAEELKHMSPKCASLLEAQRTASRAVRNTLSFGELQSNYRRECGENQSMARQRLYEEKRQQQTQAALDNRKTQIVKLQQEKEVALKSTQCLEMRSALDARKKRSNPSEGDLRDVGLFEERYKARCE